MWVMGDVVNASVSLSLSVPPATVVNLPQEKQRLASPDARPPYHNLECVVPLPC